MYKNQHIFDSLFDEIIEDSESFQFAGTISELREDNMVLVGDYMAEDDEIFSGGNKVVTVFFNEDTTFIRRNIFKKELVLDELAYAEENSEIQIDKQLETVSLAQFREDSEMTNFLVRVISPEGISGLDVFNITTLEYSVFVK